jgi:transposase
MPMLAEAVDAVIGVDTHTDTHTACLIDRVGREIATVTVDATPAGYAELLGWAVQQAPGPRVRWAIEGCRSHGAGLLRVLLAAGHSIVQAGRPQRAGRRPGGKSDTADARLAAHTALAATHHAQPRGDGDREALRILLVAREHANSVRTMPGTQPPTGPYARRCAAWPGGSACWTKRSAPTNGSCRSWSRR